MAKKNFEKKHIICPVFAVTFEKLSVTSKCMLKLLVIEKLLNKMNHIAHCYWKQPGMDSGL
jgi:hypothetical protein